MKKYLIKNLSTPLRNLSKPLFFWYILAYHNAGVAKMKSISPLKPKRISQEVGISVGNCWTIICARNRDLVFKWLQLYFQERRISMNPECRSHTPVGKISKSMFDQTPQAVRDRTSAGLWLQCKPFESTKRPHHGFWFEYQVNEIGLKTWFERFEYPYYPKKGAFSFKKNYSLLQWDLNFPFGYVVPLVELNVLMGSVCWKKFSISRWFRRKNLNMKKATYFWGVMCEQTDHSWQRPASGWLSVVGLQVWGHATNTHHERRQSNQQFVFLTGLNQIFFLEKSSLFFGFTFFLHSTSPTHAVRARRGANWDIIRSPTVHTQKMRSPSGYLVASKKNIISGTLLYLAWEIWKS